MVNQPEGTVNETTLPASPTDRREFIGQLATAAVALAGTACVTAAGGAVQAAPAPAPAPRAPSPVVKWDDAWSKRIAGKHKAVFDAPEIADGTIISNAWVWLRGYKDAYGTLDDEMSAVLVIRHGAIPMAMDDAFWEKYDLGKYAKTRDPATKKWARRNPYWKPDPNDKENAPFTLEALNGRGCILMGCSLAAMGMAGELAGKHKLPRDDVRAEVKAHLIPGMTLAPNGVFAVMRAQEAGCTYIRST